MSTTDSKRDMNPAGQSRQAAMDSLFEGLSSANRETRDHARMELERIGEAAVPGLLRLLDSRDASLRWQGAKALSVIASPDTTQRLIELLGDEVFDIRWLATEGLIALEVRGLEAALEALAVKSSDAWLRDAVHHVVAHWAGEDVDAGHHHERHLRKDTRHKQALKPVLEALHALDSATLVPVAARAALDEIRKSPAE